MTPLCPVCETPRAPGALDCPTCGAVFEVLPVPAGETLEGLETTLLPAVAPPAPEPLTGLAATAVAGPEPAAPAGASGLPAPCRCGAPASESPFCEACGRRRPRVLFEEIEPLEEDGPCPACGARGFSGILCRSCGLRRPA